MKVTIVKGDITEAKAEAIVNPANSYGRMGGGVAGVILRKGGKEIENEAIKKGPIPIGKAVLTGAGSLSCTYVIHAPTMKQPAQLTTAEKVKKATEAALVCAEENDIKSIAFPGMGTGVGGVKPDDAAKAMLDAIESFQGTRLSEIVLVAYDDALYNAFGNALSKKE